MIKKKMQRFVSALLAVVFIINMLDLGALKDGLASLRAYAAATDYSVGFKWDVSELVNVPEGGFSSESGNTTTVKDSANNTLREVTLSDDKTQLALKEYEDENPILKTVFSFNLKRGIDPGNIEFTITGLDELIRNGTLSLNMTDPNLVKTWKIEKVPGEDKYVFKNQVRVTSNNETTFTWQFNSRDAVNLSDITLQTSCTVKEYEIDPETGEQLPDPKTIVLDTNPITFGYQSEPDNNDVRIVCEDIDKLDVNNLNTDYDWRSYRSMLGLDGFIESEKENKVNPTTDDYDAHYISQDKTAQEESLRARGIKTSDYFIEVDIGDFAPDDVMVVNAKGDRVPLEYVEIDGITYYGFYDFINHGNYKPGESYSSVYRVGVLNSKVKDANIEKKEIKLTGHYLVTYNDETKVTDITDSAAHTLTAEDKQSIGEGNVFYKHNNYEVTRTVKGSDGIEYKEHSRPASPVNRLLYDSIFNDKVVTYYLYADTNQVKTTKTNENGDTVETVEAYDLVYEDTAPSIEHLLEGAPTGTAHTLNSDEYDFTRVKVYKLIDGNTVGIDFESDGFTPKKDADGNIIYKTPTGFNYDVYGRSYGSSEWKTLGSGNTVADSEVFLPEGIDEVRIVVRKLTIRASITAELDVKYNVDDELYPYIYIDSEHLKADDNTVYVDTNEGTRLRNTFTRTQYVGSYENPSKTLYNDSTYSLSWLRESTTVIDSGAAISEFKFHNAWEELTEEEQAEVGSFQPSDYYTTNITASGTVQSDSESALNHFAVVSRLPDGVTPTEDWLEEFKKSFVFSGVIQGTNELVDAKFILDNDAVSVYYDNEKRLIVAEFNFDGYSLKSDELTSVKFTYPASISLGKVKASGQTQSQFVAETYVTVLDPNAKLSPAPYKSLVSPEDNPFSNTQASKASAGTNISAMGSQKSNYSEKAVSSYYNEWIFENTAEVDGSNTDHLDADTHRMTSEYTYDLSFRRNITTENEPITDPMILDIVEGLDSSAWKGYVKSISFNEGYYPEKNGSDGYEPAVYYLLENAPSVTNSSSGDYKKTNSSIMNAISKFQKYGNTDDVVGDSAYAEDLALYLSLKEEIRSQTGGWTKAAKLDDGSWEINQENVYAVAVIFEGNYIVTQGSLQLRASLNMRAPALENDADSTNNNRASYNEVHMFAEGFDPGNNVHYPMYSVSNKTLVILRHSVELVKVSSRDGRRLTGAEFAVYNSTTENDYVHYWTFDKKRNKNEDHYMSDMEVDLGGTLELNLSPGIYYYKEIKAPTGFQADDSLYRFRVVADSNAVYYYTVDLKTAAQTDDEYLVINNDEFDKYKDSIYAGKQPVSNSAVFHVFDGSSIVGHFRWDSAEGAYVYDETELVSPLSDLSCLNGTVTIKKLPAGTYFFGKTADDKDGYYFSVADNSSIKLRVMKKSIITNVTYNVYERSGTGISANDKLIAFTGGNGSYSLSGYATDTSSAAVTPASDGNVNITGLDTSKEYYLTIKSAPEGFKTSNTSVYDIKNESGLSLYAAEQLQYTGRIVVEDDPIEVASAKFRKIDGTEGENFDTSLNGAYYNMYLVESDGSETKLYFKYNTESKQYIYAGTAGNSALTDSLVSGTTNTAQGMIEVNGLPYGTYFLQETKAPSGYQLDEKKQYFRVSATTIDVTGNLHFSDTSSSESQEPENVEDATIMIMTDSEIKSRIVLIKNDYDEPSEYLKDAAYRLYRLKANTDSEVSQEDYLAAAASASFDAKGNTANANFVKYWGEEPVGQEYTDATGSATFDNLDFGTYLVYEYRAPIGYTWNNDKDKWFTWTTKNKTPVQGQIIVLSAATISANSDTRTVIGTDEGGNEYAYEQTDYYAFYSNHLDERQTGEARLLKTDNNRNPLTDGNFTLYKVNFTDNEIKAYLDKDSSYTLTADDKEAALAEMTSANVIPSEHIVNGTPIPTDTVIKENLSTGADPSVGGTEVVSGLEWGTYYFFEVKAPSGYSRDTTPKFFDVDSDSVGTTIEVGMTDDKIYGEIWLYKQAKEKISGTEEHLKLFGAQFDLFDSNNEAVRAVPRLRLGGLDPRPDNGVAANGRKEFLVKSFNVVNNQKIEFTILDDNGTEYTVTVDYENTADGKLTYLSVAEPVFTDKYGNNYNSDYQAGDEAKNYRDDLRLAYYAISSDGASVYDDGTKKYLAITATEAACITGNYVTADEGGRLNIRGLDWGSYYFRETVPPEGYGLSEDVIFTVNAYNCDNQFIKCEDPAASATIIIDKEIPSAEYFKAYGEPTFMFKAYALTPFTLDDTVNNLTPAYTYNSINYRKTGREFTVAIHMSSTKGSAILSVPKGQYLIEELPVSRYECYDINVVGSQSEGVKVKSASLNTNTSAYLFENHQYEINNDSAAKPFTAFCDLTGGDASFSEQLVFRVKYQNCIKRYDNFSEVTFADNHIPGQRYVTAFKPIYTPLIPIGSYTTENGIHTYEIDLAKALESGDFKVVLTYNTGDTRELTVDELASKIKFKPGATAPFTDVQLTSDNKLLLKTTTEPSSIAGQTFTFDVGYADGGLATYDVKNTAMVRGSLDLTFSTVLADVRKRIILKNDVNNRSWFGENATSGKTSLALTYIKSGADGTVTSDPPNFTDLSTESGYVLNYWYLLGKDGMPVIDSSTGEVMQFADYEAIKAYIFDGTMPSATAAFKDADAYLREPDKISGFTFQAEVEEAHLRAAFNNISNYKGETNGTYLRYQIANLVHAQNNQNTGIQRTTAIIRVPGGASEANLNAWKAADGRGFLSRTAYSSVDGIKPTIKQEQWYWDNDTKKYVSVYQNSMTKDYIDPDYPVPIYAYAVKNTDDTEKWTVYWFSDDPNPMIIGSIDQLFHWQCWYLTDISGLSSWDTSLMTNAYRLFGEMKNNDFSGENHRAILKNYDFSNWDLSNCENLNDMFKWTNLVNTVITFKNGTYEINSNGKPILQNSTP